MPPIDHPAPANPPHRRAGRRPRRLVAGALVAVLGTGCLVAGQPSSANAETDPAFGKQTALKT